MDQVIVNPQSGLAELHAPEAASELLSQGYHLPLHDADGNSFSAPHDQASELIHSGQYRQPNPAELNSWLEHAHYNSPSQKAMAFIEGASRGVAGPLAPELEEGFLGVPKAEQLKRKEYLPGTSLTGELGAVAGLTALSSGFFGAAKAGRIAEAAEALPFIPNLIQKAGQAASEGIAAEGTFGRIAKAATAGAIESALYTAQNKFTEASLGDPNALSEHMIADIGLSALIGGGIGGAVTAGAAPFSMVSKKLEKLEGLIKSKIPKGEVGYSAAPDLARLEEPGYQFKSAVNIDKKTWLDKFKGLMPDVGIADVIALATNAHGIGAYHALKLAGKLTPEKLVDIFSDQAPKALPIIESLKTGLSSLSKIETKSAGLFGYGAASAVENTFEPGKLHNLHDETIKMEADPRILIQNLQDKIGPISKDMPDTTIALSQKLNQAGQLLSMARPNLNKKAMLDKDPTPTTDQIHKFNNVSQAIDNPVSVLDHVKSGSISNDQMFVLKTLYPNVLKNIQKETMKNLMQYQADKKPPLDYKMRLGLSKLLGQPLDSSLHSLAQNQMALGGMQAAKQAQEMQQSKPSKSGMSKMKFASRDKTRAQQSVERNSA